MTAYTQPKDKSSDAIPVIDYEGSQYRTDFWVGQGRDYEDAVERAALDLLLPKRGKRIAEIGAGFGRLANMYLGYEQIILFDYSRTLLKEAVQQWGDDPRFIFVAGNIYQLPLVTRVLDTLVMIRVMHHLADVPMALTQLRRVLHGHSTAIIEYANKRNLKAIARWAVQRQQWSPFAPEPHEFVELNFDFHPEWMASKFADAGLDICEQFAVSHFRLPLLKRNVSAAKLVQLDKVLFRAGGLAPIAPSVFVQAQAACEDGDQSVASVTNIVGLFRCPQCLCESLKLVADDKALCPECDTQYLSKDKVWDFKDPVL